MLALSLRGNKLCTSSFQAQDFCDLCPVLQCLCPNPAGPWWAVPIPCPWRCQAPGASLGMAGTDTKLSPSLVGPGRSSEALGSSFWVLEAPPEVTLFRHFPCRCSFFSFIFPSFSFFFFFFFFYLFISLFLSFHFIFLPSLQIKFTEFWFNQCKTQTLSQNRTL